MSAQEAGYQLRHSHIPEAAVNVQRVHVVLNCLIHIKSPLLTM
jgi:hypothetical protein